MAAWTRFLACAAATPRWATARSWSSTIPSGWPWPLWAAMAEVEGEGLREIARARPFRSRGSHAIWDSVPYTLALERIKDEQIDDMYKE